MHSFIVIVYCNTSTMNEYTHSQYIAAHITYTPYPIWSDVFDSSFTAQSSQLECLFCHISVKRDVRAFRARKSLLPHFSEKRRSSFELELSIFFRKCHSRWDRVYMQWVLQCIVNVYIHSWWMYCNTRLLWKNVYIHNGTFIVYCSVLWMHVCIHRGYVLCLCPPWVGVDGRVLVVWGGCDW